MIDYSVEIEVPLTKTHDGFLLVLSPNTQNVLRIETELKKDKRNISNLLVRLVDPKQSIFNSIPDIAFSNVPIKLFLSKKGGGTPTHKVFEGKITQITMGYPSPEVITIIAHDESIDLRKKNSYKLFKNLTSVQLAKKIASEYGMTVDVGNLGDVQLKQKTVHFGPEIDDYTFIGRALDSDGLELYTVGKTIKIRQKSKIPYAVPLKRNESPVISLEVQLNYIGKDSSNIVTQGKDTGANRVSALPPNSVKQDTRFDNQGSDATGAQVITHKGPVGAPTLSSIAHGEEPLARDWTNKTTQKRLRKDTASLTLISTPDITLDNCVNLVGWGPKVDKTWYIASIKHTIAIESGAAYTTLSLTGPPAKKTKEAVIGKDTGANYAKADVVSQ